MFLRSTDATVTSNRVIIGISVWASQPNVIDHWFICIALYFSTNDCAQVICADRCTYPNATPVGSFVISSTH